MHGSKSRFRKLRRATTSTRWLHHGDAPLSRHDGGALSMCGGNFAGMLLFVCVLPVLHFHEASMQSKIVKQVPNTHTQCAEYVHELHAFFCADFGCRPDPKVPRRRLSRLPERGTTMTMKTMQRR